MDVAAPREATELLERRAFRLDPRHELVTDDDRDIELAGQPLQAARGVHRIADHGVVQALSITDASHDRFTVMDSDADLHGHGPASHSLLAPAPCLFE